MSRVDLNWYTHKSVTCECGRAFEIEYQQTIFRDRCKIACNCGRIIFSDSGAAFYRANPVGHSDEPDYLL